MFLFKQQKNAIGCLIALSLLWPSFSFSEDLFGPERKDSNQVSIDSNMQDTLPSRSNLVAANRKFKQKRKKRTSKRRRRRRVRMSSWDSYWYRLKKAEVSARGEFRLEGRIFEDDNNSQTKDLGLGARSMVDVGVQHGFWKEKMKVSTRVDKYDDSRGTFVIEDLLTSYKNRNWELRVGSQTLNWTATEAFHPADIINSKNLDSNFENAEKLGEPMVQYLYLFENSSFSIFYLPMVVDPIVPGPNNRLNLVPNGLAVGKPIWIDSNQEQLENEFAVQYAIRWDQSFDSIDYSLHYVKHIDRTQPASYSLDGSAIRPIFLSVQQIGGTYQQVVGDWVVKLEWAHRDFMAPFTHAQYGSIDPKDHDQLALGLDYGFSHEDGKDSTFILEGQRYLGVEKEDRALLGTFQSDVLFGYRLAWNDIYSQELFASVIVDTERSKEILLNLSYTRRLNDVWGLKSGIRVIEAPQKETSPVGLEQLDKADQIYFELTRYF